LFRIRVCGRDIHEGHGKASFTYVKQTLHKELAIALCFVFLYLAVGGGGRLSADAVWRG
jgi:uncharacterized membrane protein YphA (DoxX/SURF4 family)